MKTTFKQMVSIAFLISFSVQADTEESIREKLNTTRISSLKANVYAVPFFRFLAHRANCKLLLCVADVQNKGKTELPEIKNVDLPGVSISNNNDRVIVHLDVKDVSEMELLSCIASKAGFAWRISDEGIVIDVSNEKKYSVKLSTARNARKKKTKLYNVSAKQPDNQGEHLSVEFRADNSESHLILMIRNNSSSRMLKETIAIQLPKGLTTSDIIKHDKFIFSDINRDNSNFIKLSLELRPNEVKTITFKGVPGTALNRVLPQLPQDKEGASGSRIRGKVNTKTSPRVVL